MTEQEKPNCFGLCNCETEKFDGCYFDIECDQERKERECKGCENEKVFLLDNPCIYCQDKEYFK